MVSPHGFCCRDDILASSPEYCEYHTSSSRHKRRRTSYSCNVDCLSPLNEGRYDADNASSQPIAGVCSTGSSSCYNLELETNLDSGTEMECQLNGNSNVGPLASVSRGVSCPDVNQKADHASFVAGWMYINEQGQMCGPYFREQLYEGLSTGFLPEELPVYPVMNGKMMNSVPLKYFTLYPDHVATGFTHLGNANYSMLVTKSFSSPSNQGRAVGNSDLVISSSSHLEMVGSLRAWVHLFLAMQRLQLLGCLSSSIYRGMRSVGYLMMAVEENAVHILLLSCIIGSNMAICITR